MITKPNQICLRCVMDTSAKDIHFDKNGICNYCSDLLASSHRLFSITPTERESELAKFVAKVIKEGRGKRYDCVIGVSGGVDSSWALVKALNLGLRPLAVHMDNGWNSELSQNNIANLVRGLGVDLYTHVIDWQEYRRLMQAFFDANVVDVELLYDNAMQAVNYRQAAANDVNFILSGMNTSSEGLRMPPDWSWFKYDRCNIKSIAYRFGRVKINSFPAIGTLERIWHEVIRKRRWISFLDYFDYNKLEAMEYLQNNLGYKPYPYKHYESIFTRFYQGYILPTKFGVDKRRVHLSSLIISGQLSRENALRNLESIPYPSIEDLEEDKTYFLKKMGWTRLQLDEYLARPAIPHSYYRSERRLYDGLNNLYTRAPYFLWSK